MKTVPKILKLIQSKTIAKRNRRQPFEFGAVQDRDRMMVSSRLQNRGQGNLLDISCTFDTSLVLPSGSTLPDIKSAAAAFRCIQIFFESSAVEKKLKPWRVLGFMSDSLEANGIAGVLHDDDEKVQFINVTAGAYFHTLYSAYHLLSDKRVEPSLPMPGKYITGHAAKLFNIELNIPLAPERRKLALRYALAALRVTFFHELAHIFRGHLVYLRRIDGTGNGAIVEASPSVLKNSPTIDIRRRALETDADDFSGRFMATAFFRDFKNPDLTLANPNFRARANEVLAGVVLMYSWYAESEGYHNGSLRAYWVLSSMFAELGLDMKASAQWTQPRVSGLQTLMSEFGLIQPDVGFLSEVKVTELIQDTEYYRRSNMNEWLKCRPWGFDGNG